MNIGLLGFSDKRHIVYTLIRVLGGFGRMIFFTQNKQYLMLSEEHLTEFEINDVQIVIFSGDIDELSDEYELGSYEYVIYDVQDELPLHLDTVLLMDSHDYYAFDLEDRGMDDIPIFCSDNVEKIDLMPKEKQIVIPPASMVEDGLQAMFQTRTLLPVKNRVFLKAMTVFIASIAELQESFVLAQLKKEVMEV